MLQAPGAENQRHYAAYGVDLIRTAGLLLRMPPSTTYRASLLLQRFEAIVFDCEQSVSAVARECMRIAVEDTPGTSGAEAESMNREERTYLLTSPLEYVYPKHYARLRAGNADVPRLGDLFAPLDARIVALVNGIQQLPEALRRRQAAGPTTNAGEDDLLYLAAGCLLVAAKMEDTSVRIRQIVTVFACLKRRRRNEPVAELSSERYEAFKSRVVEAEEELLHMLGFQTFVEYPVKYVFVFVDCILRHPQPPADAAAAAAKASPSNTHRASAHQHVAVLRARWLSDAVAWINDLPRCADLCFVAAPVLAVSALAATLPTDVRKELPADWTLAFGVEESETRRVQSLAAELIGEARGTPSELLIFANVVLPDLSYQIEGTKGMFTDSDECAGDLEVAEAGETHPPTAALPPPDTEEALRLLQLPASLGPASPAGVAVPPTPVAAPVPSQAATVAVCSPISVSSPARLSVPSVLPTQPPAPALTAAPALAPAPSEPPEPEFEDLSVMRARRRQEEKERERELRREKRHRSRSREERSKKSKKDKGSKSDNGVPSRRHRRSESPSGGEAKPISPRARDGDSVERRDRRERRDSGERRRHRHSSRHRDREKRERSRHRDRS